MYFEQTIQPKCYCIYNQSECTMHKTTKVFKHFKAFGFSSVQREPVCLENVAWA